MSVAFWRNLKRELVYFLSVSTSCHIFSRSRGVWVRKTPERVSTGSTAESWARFLLLTACYFHKIQGGVRKTDLGENKQWILRHKILITFSTVSKRNSMQLKNLILFVSYSKSDLMLHIQVWTGRFCWISLNKHRVSFEVLFESTQK